MQTIEIPRRTWAQRLNEFTAVHEGWLVSVDIVGPEAGRQREVWHLPLLGISADRADHEPIIEVSVARSATEHLTHVIRDVVHISVEQTDTGADAALQIASADGTKTVVRLRTAALPETVDGIA